MKENIKWERGKSNPLETYVDDQSATLTMLSNAAFVVGSECSELRICRLFHGRNESEHLKTHFRNLAPFN